MSCFFAPPSGWAYELELTTVEFYLRTQSRALPSERTVKQVLVPLILPQLVHLPTHGVLQKIRRCLVAAAEDESEDHHSAA